ncbi:MAG TPA: hypothetical protein VI258_06500, partial [Rhodanobacteraceae bacterium]
PGMTATVHIVTAKRDNVLRVPDQALRFTPGGVVGTAGTNTPRPVGDSDRNDQAAVWVLRNGQPVRVPVTVGLDDDQNAEIVSGDLQPGDRVIVGTGGGSGGANGGGRQGGQGRGSTPRLRF